jgi:hypothetical protein
MKNLQGARFGRLSSFTRPLYQFANGRFAWQTGKPLHNKVLMGQFATLPTPLSGGKYYQVDREDNHKLIRIAKPR